MLYDNGNILALWKSALASCMSLLLSLEFLKQLLLQIMGFKDTSNKSSLVIDSEYQF